jgi:hypothetical protein
MGSPMSLKLSSWLLHKSSSDQEINAIEIGDIPNFEVKIRDLAISRSPSGHERQHIKVASVFGLCGGSLAFHINRLLPPLYSLPSHPSIIQIQFSANPNTSQAFHQLQVDG